MPPSNQIIIYQSDDGQIRVNALMQDESMWLSQEQIALLFGKAKSTINEHIKNIYLEGELSETETVHKFGISEFQQKAPNHYNLDMILAVGYRVRSQQGIAFRTWASSRLKEYLIQGFSLDEAKLKSGKPTEYFDKLQSRLREIRLSERLFYQKIKDIYTTSIDYDPGDERTIEFFRLVQNKLLWAISHQTAAELVHSRVDISLPLLGMQSYDKKGSKEITKKDVSVAKNYLNEDEMKTLGLLVEQYLAFAESMAQSQTPMTMLDWISRLDMILQMNGKEILTHYGKISHDLAVAKAEKEYEKLQIERKNGEKIESVSELEKDIKQLKS